MRRPWWLRNWYDTAELGADPGPLDLAVCLPEAMASMERAIQALPQWQLQSRDSANGVIRATRKTKTCRFVDDVLVQFTPTAQGTRIQVQSRSRIGIVDLGQNRRNIRELFAALT